MHEINWENICPKNILHEIYIIGNPPYSGSRRQTQLTKEDMKYFDFLIITKV